MLDEANELLNTGRHAEAEVLCRRVLATDRSSARANLLLARALRFQGVLDEAALAARRATTSAPRSAAAHTELGAVLYAQDRAVEAMRALAHALELDRNHVEAHNFLGVQLSAMGQLDEALANFRQVTRLTPDHPSGYLNVGRTLSQRGDHVAALQAYEHAAALGDETPHLRFNRAFPRLGTGDLVGGWEDYDFGPENGQRKPHRQPPVPRWNGADLDGQRILLWREQGLGDEVRFASCYPDVIERAAGVVIECTPRLVELFTRSFPCATVRAETFDNRQERETASFDGIDVHSPAGSLPRFLRRSIDDFPEHDGYLTADADLRARWRERLAELGDGLKVGVAWRSMNLQTARLAHYLTLDELDPVLRLAGIRLVNLQYGPVDQLETELRDLEERPGVTVHRWDDIDYTNDLDAVAALTAELDVVVGPGSFPTVLAGALGVPTLVLTAPTPWTLGERGEDPWFPETRHFVRAWDEPWQRVTEAAAEHIRQLLADTAAS